jgi:hypothetical protein
LRQVVYDVLKHTLRAEKDGTLLHSFEASSGVQSLREADFGWPLMRESWKFLASEIEAA